MILIFSSVTLDPRQRLGFDAEIAEWLAATELERSAAEIYKYLVDPADPSRAYVFQFWRDDAAFATWTEQLAFNEILDRYRKNESLTDVGAVIFEGCTSTRGGPLQPSGN